MEDLFCEDLLGEFRIVWMGLCEKFVSRMRGVVVWLNGGC